METVKTKQIKRRVAEEIRKIPPGEVRRKFFFLEGTEEEEETDVEIDESVSVEPRSSSSLSSSSSSPDSFFFPGRVSERSVEVKKLPLAGEEEETSAKALLISSVVSYCSCKPETVL